MLKASPANLKKVENIFKEVGYKIIYEKGHFQSGYCIVNTQKIIVVNKFYKTDARISCLIAILKIIELDETALDADTLDWYKVILNQKQA